MIDYIFIILFAILGFGLSLGITWFLLPIVMRYMKKKGKIGIDVHKMDKPEIPEMGGLAVYISINIVGLVIFLISFMIYPSEIFTYQILAFVLATLIGGGIGIIDDKFRLSGKVKPIILILGGIPIIYINFYMVRICYPYPMFPLIGYFHITIIEYFKEVFQILERSMGRLRHYCDPVLSSDQGSQRLYPGLGGYACKHKGTHHASPAHQLCGLDCLISAPDPLYQDQCHESDRHGGYLCPCHGICRQ